MNPTFSLAFLLLWREALEDILLILLLCIFLLPCQFLIFSFCFFFRFYCNTAPSLCSSVLEFPITSSLAAFSSCFFALCGITPLFLALCEFQLIFYLSRYFPIVFSAFRISLFVYESKRIFVSAQLPHSPAVFPGLVHARAEAAQESRSHPQASV